MNANRQDHRLHATAKALLLRASALVSVAVALSAAPTIAFGQAVNLGNAPGNSIIPDGRTQTTLSVKGRTTTIRTGTLAGGNAYNSFSTFSEGAGNTVNLIVPKAANNLVNLVRDGAVNIQGTLNAYQHGQIGGNVVFADPYGMVVGKSGVVNVGGLTVVTPSGATLDKVIDRNGVVDQALAARLIAGNVPLSPDGSVVIAGQINADHLVKITAQDIRVAGSAEEARRVARQKAQFKSTVNTENMVEAGSIVVRNGSIELVAAHDAAIGGRLTAMGTSSHPGSISVHANHDVKVSATAKLSVSARREAKALAVSTPATSGPSIAISAGNAATIAGILSAPASRAGTSGTIDISANDIAVSGTATLRSVGTGIADGGTIRIKAANDTTVAAGARFIADATGTGNGGFVEISAAKTDSVDPNILINLGSVTGKAGTLLFDPDVLIIGGATQSTVPADDTVVGGSTSTMASLYTNGANIELDATSSITINGVIDTRKYAGDTTSATQVTGLLSASHVASTGSSGSIVLVAPTITLAATGALYADVNDTSQSGYTAGNVSLVATYTDSEPSSTSLGPARASSAITIAGTITGANVSAISTSTASLNFTSTPTGFAALPTGVAAGTFLGVNGGYVASNAGASVTIASTANIIASGDVTLSSVGSETAVQPAITLSQNVAQSIGGASVIVGEIDAAISTTVNSGAHISSGGNLTVSAVNAATLAINALSASVSGTVEATVAYSTGTITTQATIKSGAFITKAASVTVAAQNTNSFSTSASSMAFGVGQAGIAIAYSDIQTSASASLGASVPQSAGANGIVVYSGSDTILDSTQASTSVGSPALVGGILTGITNASDVIGKFFSPGGVFSNTAYGEVANESGMGSAVDRGGFTLALNEQKHASTASIAGTTTGFSPTVYALGPVAVVSLLTDAGVHTGAASSISTLSVPGSPPVNSVANPATQGGLSMAVDVTQITHVSNAYIGSGATVTGTEIVVDAQTSMPITNSWLDFDSFGAVTSHISGNLGIVSNILTSYANASADSSTQGLSGAGNYFEVTNETTAWVASGATLTQITLPAGTTAVAVPSFALDGSNNLTIAGLGFSSSFQTITVPDAITVQALTATQSINIGGNFSWLTVFGTNSTDASAKAVGGSFNADIFHTTTTAGIAAGVHVTAAGSVAVIANTADLVYGIAPTAGRGSGEAFNAIVSLEEIDNTTSASISNAATVSASAVAVQARQDLSGFDVAGAIGYSKGEGVGLALATDWIRTNTSASIGANGSVLPSSASGDDGNVAGSATVGSITTSSLSVIAETVGRLTNVSVAALAANDTAPTTPDPEQPASMDALENEIFGFYGNPALGRAIALGLTIPDEGIKNGSDAFAGAGSASLNLTNISTSASIALATLNVPANASNTSLTVQALNDTIVNTAGGSAALAIGGVGTDNTVGIAGAVAVNISSGSTTATVSSSTIHANNVQVQALQGGQNTVIGLAVALAAGAAVDNSGAASASVSFARIHDAVDATIINSTLTGDGGVGAGSLLLTAYQSTQIGIGAGSLSADLVGGGAGIGVALTYAEISDGSSGDAVSATLMNTGVSSLGSITVTALDNSRILSGAATGAGGVDATGFAGAIVVNDISPAVLAEIGGDGSSGAPSIGVSGNVVVSSTGGTNATLDALLSAETANATTGALVDQSNIDFWASAVSPTSATGAAIIGVAGQVGIGKANVGISLVVNRIAQVNQAIIAGAAVSAGGSVSVTAYDNAEILGIAVGASISSGSGAGLGSVVYNSITDGVAATIGDFASGANLTAVTATGISIVAQDGSTIRGATGAIAANLNSKAVGLSATIDQIANYVSADVVHASVTVTQPTATTGVDGSLIISASSNANITSAAVTAALTAGLSATAPSVSGGSSPLQTLLQGFVPASLVRLHARTNPPSDPGQPSQPSGGLTGAGSLVLSTEATSVYADIIQQSSMAPTTVNAQNNIVLLAQNSDAITDYAGSLALSAGSGSTASASVLINEISGTTDALVSGASVNARGIASGYSIDNGVLAGSVDPSSVVTPGSVPSLADGTTTIDGIAIIAASRQTVDAVSAVASGSASGNALAANIITNIMSAHTDAYALNARIDTDSSVATGSSDLRIAASSAAFANNLDIGMAGSGGSAAATIAVVTNTISGTTSAYSSGSTIGTSGAPTRAVTIFANAWEGTSGEVIGAAASDGTGLAGSALANIFSAETSAYAVGGTINAGSLAVNAATTDGYFGVVGNSAIGGSAGIGAGVIVATMNNTTSAYLGSASNSLTANLNGPVSVGATTTTKTNSYDVGVSVGGSAGVAAMVTVNILTNTTSAGIDHATISIPTTATAATSGISVNALEIASINPLTGGLSAGGSAGIGASVNVAVLKSSNSAFINASTITTPGAVSVSATSDRDINMITVTGGLGGQAALAGTVGVVLIGNAASSDELSVIGASTGSADTATGSNGTANAALSSGTDGISAAITGGTITAGSVGIAATGDVETLNIVGTVAVGGLGGFGAAVGYTDVTQGVTAQATGGTIHTATLTIATAAGDDGSGNHAAQTMAVAGAGGLFVGLGAAVAVSHINNTLTSNITSTVNNGTATVNGVSGTVASTSIAVNASDSSSSLADAYGFGLGIAAVGASVADAERTSHVTAEASSGAQLTAQTVTVQASGSGAAYALGIGGAGGVIGLTGVDATATDNSDVVATVLAGSSIAAVGGLTVSASDTPDSKAFAFGVSVGAAAAGTSISDAESTATVAANVDGGAVLTNTNGLTITASVAVNGTPATSFPTRSTVPGATTAFATGQTTAAAWSIAGSGGVEYAVNATVATANSATHVTASAGNATSDSLLLPWGAISISATNTTDQAARGDGVAISGGLAVGAVLANATSSPTTTAMLGKSTRSTNQTVDAQGNVTVAGTQSIALNATGTDTNNALAQAGAGGFVAGNGAKAATTDNSTVLATIGDNSRIAANTISVIAQHTDNFGEEADSLNAGVVGASAALATHDATTPTSVTIGSGVELSALAAGLAQGCAGNGCEAALSFNASNSYIDLSSGTRAGAGGGVNGAGAISTININTSGAGTGISIGTGDDLTAGTDPGLAPGSIALIAHSSIQINDLDTLTTGGVIQGAGVNSTINGTIANAITVGSGVTMATYGSLNIATYSLGSLFASGDVSTYGAAAVGSADAHITLTDNETITIQSSATSQTALAAFYTINITAGEDLTHALQTSLSGNTSAEGYVRGLIAVPEADATTTIASNATVNLGTSSGVFAGQDVHIDAYHDLASVTADGTGHGYELGFIPVTSGHDNTSTPTSSSVVLNGTVVAGQYHTLTLTVNADGSVSENAGGAPVNVTYQATTTSSCAGGVAASCLFSASEFQTLLSHGDVSSGNIAAVRLGALFASGGAVEIKADTLSGHGSLFAYGSPSITVNDAQPIALVFTGGAYIPDVPGGLINFTGAAQARDATAAGIAQTATGSSSAGTITISLTNNSGTQGAGPPIIVDAPLTNLGGTITINNANGSLVYQTVYVYDSSGNVVTNSDGSPKVFSIGGSQANQLEVTVPYGALIVDANSADGSYIAGASPVTEFSASAVYPGGPTGNGSGMTGSNASQYFDLLYSGANDAMMYVASSIYQNHLQGVDSLPDNSANANGTINNVLYGQSGPNNAQQSGVVLVTACGQSASSTCGNVLLGNIYGIQGYPEPGYTNYQLTYAINDRSLESTAGSAASKQIYGNLIEVHAATIDVNGAIYAGPPTTYNVALGTNVGSLISALQQYRSAVQSGDLNTAFSISAQLSNTYGQNTAFSYDVAALLGGSIDVSSYLSFASNSATNVTASYSFATGQISLSSIEAHSTGASIILDGAIISSNTLGNIHVNSGFGQVSINNQSGIALALQGINTGDVANASAATSSVMIVDRLKDQHYQTTQNDTTTFVYNPATGIKEYISSNGAKSLNGDGTLANGASLYASIAGTTSSYSPVQGAAYEYVQEAQLSRTLQYGQNTLIYNNFDNRHGEYFGVNGSSGWVFTGTPGQPYYYVSPGSVPSTASGQVSTSGISQSPVGAVIVEDPSSPLFQETIFGNVIKDTRTNSSGAVIDNSGQALGCYQGYQCAGPFVGNTTQNPEYFLFFPDKAFVRVTSVERADNPISINFTGSLYGSATVTSNAAVTIAGNIKNPNGTTSISTSTSNSTASISEVSGTSITGSSINLTAGGGIGSVNAPITATVTSGIGTTIGSFSASAFGGDVNVVLNSSANGFTARSQTGDVRVAAAGTLTAGSGSVAGNNITLSSTGGGIGSATALLPVQTNNGGILNVTAQGDIGLRQASGNLLIGQIRSNAGDVAITVDNGNIYDALSQTPASALSSTQVASIAASLHLIGTSDADAGGAAVASFAASVNASLSSYATFLANGSIASGSLGTLDATTLALYAPFANSAAISAARANQTGTSQFTTPGTAAIQATAASMTAANGLFTLTITSANRASYQTQAGAALGIAATSVTDTQIQAWANARYQAYANLFSQAYGTNWQATVATTGAAQARINADLTGYNQLIAARAASAANSGTTFTLAASALAGYRAAAAQALGISNVASVTDAQVQTYANSLYQGYVADFTSTFGSDWQTTVASTTTYAPYSVASGSALAASLTASSNWTAQQIVQAIDVAALQPSASTVGSAATPDIVGHNVTLVTQSGAIGTYNQNGITITLAELTSGTLSAAEQAALAVATTPGSISLIGQDASGHPLAAGTNLTNLPGGATVSAIRITQTAPVFVNASGAFTITAAGAVYLQATSSSSIAVNHISAGGDVDLKAPGSIQTATVAGVPMSSTQISTPGSLDLVASSGSIGSASTPFSYQIGGTLLNASAGGDSYLNVIGGNALIQRDFAGGTASVTTAAGYSILSDLSGINISADAIILSSGANIGSTTTSLAVLTSGSLSGSANGLINISAPTSSGGQANALTITSLTGSGDVSIASGGMLTISSLLRSINGAVSTTSSAFSMAANSSIDAAGSISISSLGDAVLATLQSGLSPQTAADTVTIVAGGSILSATSGLDVVTGVRGTLSLSATQGIGSALNALLIDGAPLLSAVTTGTNAAIYIQDVAALNASQISATGLIWLNATALTADGLSSGTTLAATATTGTITLGSATSGTGQTLTASRDIGFTMLTALAGDITATSTNGVISGTTVTASGNAGLTAHGDVTLMSATATNGALSLASDTGHVNGTTLIAGTTLSVTATTGAITLGSATSGTGQTLTASGDIGFTMLTALAGGITATSTNGGISGTTVTASGSAGLTAHGDVTLTSATATNGALSLASDTGHVNGTTLVAGTTLSVTATAGTITLGSATSGGTETVHAQGALTYTTLKTTGTGADIILTSDTASIAGQASDTLEAKGSFQLTAGTTIMATALTADAGSGTLNAAGSITVGTLSTATSLDVTATTGAITLGSATSGGTETVHAQGALTYTTLKTTGTGGDILLTSDTAAIIGQASDTLEAKGSFQLTAGTTIMATALTADAGSGTLNAAGSITVGTLSTATSLDVTATTGAITLGSATSGGTETIHAQGALTYTTLKTTGTGGDILLTSDTAAIIGQAWDTLEAMGSFQLTAGTTIVATALTADAGSGTLNAAGSITVGTLSTATSLAATATTGAITLGSATSGGTETIHAQGALTYTTLKTTGTGGDILLTSDTAAIIGQASDTLEAKGSFQLTAGTTIVATALTADAGSGTLNAAGPVTVGTLSTATSLAATATTGAITLGSATSGGTETLTASGDIGFTTLAVLAGDITATSTNGGISGTTVTASGSAGLTAHGDVTLTSATATNGALSLASDTGHVNGTTLIAGTTLAATATTGAITLGSATSGGTETIHAQGALTYTTLKTTGTGGEILLTSDTAAIIGQASDTLEAKGSFQLTAGTTIMATALTADAGSGTLNAAGSITVGTLSTATSLAATATTGAITLGSATSGGTETLTASRDIGFTTLTARAGDITATSTNGVISGHEASATGTVRLSAAKSITVDTIDPADVVLTTPGDVRVGTLVAANSVVIAASTIAIDTMQQQATGAGALAVTLEGFGGQMGTSATVRVASDNGVVFNSINETTSTIATTTQEVTIQSASLGRTLLLSMPTETLYVSAVPVPSLPGYNMQAYSPTGRFYLSQSADVTTTNSIVVLYQDGAKVREDIGGAFVSGFSLTNYTGQLLHASADTAQPSGRKAPAFTPIAGSWVGLRSLPAAFQSQLGDDFAVMVNVTGGGDDLAPLDLDALRERANHLFRRSLHERQSMRARPERFATAH